MIACQVIVTIRGEDRSRISKAEAPGYPPRKRSGNLRQVQRNSKFNFAYQ
jgi:hypothetical protein